jgi:hypothetical protein
VPGVGERERIGCWDPATRVHRGGGEALAISRSRTARDPLHAEGRIVDTAGRRRRPRRAVLPPRRRGGRIIVVVDIDVGSTIPSASQLRPVAVPLRAAILQRHAAEGLSPPRRVHPLGFAHTQRGEREVMASGATVGEGGARQRRTAAREIRGKAQGSESPGLVQQSRPHDGRALRQARLVRGRRERGRAP